MFQGQYQNMEIQIYKNTKMSKIIELIDQANIGTSTGIEFRIFMFCYVMDEWL